MGSVGDVRNKRVSESTSWSTHRQNVCLSGERVYVEEACKGMHLLTARALFIYLYVGNFILPLLLRLPLYLSFCICTIMRFTFFSSSTATSWFELSDGTFLPHEFRLNNLVECHI